MTLMLLDSGSLWYRAYYGMPDTLTADDGTPVNAIRGFLDMSARLISTYNPDRMVVCLDGDWRPSWRVELFPAYKANRLEDEESDEEAEPDTLTPQIPILLDLLDEFGIPMVGVDDYEADDVMATYAHTHRGPTRIVTGDRDLFQLVDDKRDIKVAYLAKGISAHDLVDLNFISQKYSIPGDRYAMFATFRGDASDGLPGVKGIGEKGAALISTHFESIADAIVAAQNGDERLPAALARKIVAGMDYLAIAPTVVNCARDVPLPEIELGMPKAPADFSKIYQIKEKYSLGASVDRLISALKW
ncbi:MAG: 5'-3' exonuclease [Candidatus Planktophila sp.]|jgi:5'-3' exonuclease